MSARDCVTAVTIPGRSGATAWRVNRAMHNATAGDELAHAWESRRQDARYVGPSHESAERHRPPTLESTRRGAKTPEYSSKPSVSVSGRREALPWVSDSMPMPFSTYGHRVDEPRADLLLDSPLGRQFLLECLGERFRMKLFHALGLGLPPGMGEISSDPTYRSPEPSRTWQEVGPEEVSALLTSAVGEGEWRHVLGLDELELLGFLARTTSSFGHMGRDEAEWGLTAPAREEMRPIAETLMATPSTQRWWEDVRRHDQRALWWDGTHYPSGAAVHILAQAVHQSVCLQGVTAGEGEAKIGQAGQAQSHQALLQVVHR
jgi:hypothetical protein